MAREILPKGALLIEWSDLRSLFKVKKGFYLLDFEAFWIPVYTNKNPVCKHWTKWEWRVVQEKGKWVDHKKEIGKGFGCAESVLIDIGDQSGNVNVVLAPDRHLNLQTLNVIDLNVE